MGAPSDPKEQGVCGAAVERNNGANGGELETTGSGGLHAEVRAKAGISGTGGIAMLPASSFSGANAASTRTAAPGDDRAAKRARGGEAAGQAAISALDAPISMSHVIYGGEAAPISASAFEAFGHQNGGNQNSAPGMLSISSQHVGHEGHMPQSLQSTFHNGELPGDSAPSGGIQPQSVAVTQDAVTADVVLALCGMRDSNVGTGPQYGWDANHPGSWQGSGAMSSQSVATPKRASNGRTGKRNLPTETVSILRTWYEEHQDWPYPNDSEQEALAIKTGIPAKMVNTWFINARKRRKQAQKAGGLPADIDAGDPRHKRKGGCGIVHSSGASGPDGQNEESRQANTAPNNFAPTTETGSLSSAASMAALALPKEGLTLNSTAFASVTPGISPQAVVQLAQVKRDKQKTLQPASQEQAWPVAAPPPPPPTASLSVTR